MFQASRQRVQTKISHFPRPRRWPRSGPAGGTLGGQGFEPQENSWPASAFQEPLGSSPGRFGASWNGLGVILSGFEPSKMARDYSRPLPLLKKPQLGPFTPHHHHRLDSSSLICGCLESIGKPCGSGNLSPPPMKGEGARARRGPPALPPDFIPKWYDSANCRRK